jgi:hypothetical protein
VLPPSFSRAWEPKVIARRALVTSAASVHLFRMF